jgi:exopolyphosphatase/guanosine-5'-triphosphate,3'-diphosphate pyrophosphatase
MKNGQLLAAVDLGSNSFRLEIGHLDHGQIRRVEYLKETVRQGNGLDNERNLSTLAMQRGWDCLARFAERIAGFDPSHVRAVATQTLREARNREEFLEKAQRILGFPIEVIPGREEARLIYSGVSHLLPQSNERRLVIDIGGRSTELILGQGVKATTLESYRVGSVAWSMKYFADGQFTAMAFERAEVAAKAILDEVLNAYRRKDWDIAYGSSGTIGAVVDVLEAAGWPAGLINREGLKWLKEKLIKAGRADNLKLEGIKEDRRSVIGGGLSILSSLFELLEIEELHAAQGALRQGALYDLLDRDENADIRESMVEWLSRRFGIDSSQAERVSQTATQLFQKVLPAHPVAQSNLDQIQLQKKLAWAARLHEVGTYISHSDYHKHGAYLLDNADLPGFSMPELHRLSQLVLGHRGKLRKLDANLLDHEFAHQLFALRIAVILCHARRDPDLKGFELSQYEGTDLGFTISTRKGWTAQWPQSAHLLREECIAWQKTPWSVAFNGL